MRGGWARACAVAAVALAGCDPGQAPQLDALSPEQARAGARVVISGTGLCGRALASDGVRCDESLVGRVYVGTEPPQIAATVTAWSDQDLEFIVPLSAPTGATRVVVVVDGRSSNALDFVLLP